MAERVEEAESEGAGEAGTGAISPSAAMVIGVRKGRAGNRPDARFDRFLDHQERLIDIQTEHLQEQRELALSRLRWGRFSDRIKAGLQLMTMAVGLAIAGAVAAMAWQAYEDHGVSIAAFSVPPDFVQRGLSGQVVASQVLDRLAELQARTVTARPASSYANDWGGDIKVEIPETGVSIGELNRWLRDWLGSETRITGEVTRTPTGVAVTARVGASAGRTFAGTDAQLPQLVQQAAEAVYQSTQPYRWAVYLASIGRKDQALQSYSWLAEHGSREDRAWADVAWSMALAAQGRDDESRDKARAALDLDPNIEPAWYALNSGFENTGEHEAMLQGLRAQLRMLERGRVEGVDEAQRAADIALVRHMMIPTEVGDFGQAAGYFRDTTFAGRAGEGAALTYAVEEGESLVDLHDIAGARRAIGSRPGAGRTYLAIEQEDWAAAERSTTYGERVLAAQNRAFPVIGEAAKALAAARLGRLAEAQAIIGRTPLTCMECLEVRGWIAALAGDRAGADRWFAEAARRAPSIPMPWEAWGSARLRFGDAKGAIAKAKQARRRGPRWADPLELWGEALLMQGDFDGAAGRFAEADRYAPKWGRNHLLWGEAMMLSGRYAEARAQYETAAGLGISKPDRAALDVLLARTAKGPLHG